MQRKIALSWMLLGAVATILAICSSIEAAPYTPQGYWNQPEEEDPEALLEVLRRIEHLMRPHDLENKRGVDFGVNRGFSGTQMAKHLMGLAAANYAGGPGRRRRSEQA